MSTPKRAGLKIIAAVLGILAVGALAVLFSGWLKQRGDDEAGFNAARALESAEFQLGQTIAALRDLSARGVDTCRPPHLEAMRQSALLTGPIKEVMLIAPNGRIMCTDTGGLAGHYRVAGSTATAAADIMLDVVQLSERGERFLRVRDIGRPDKPNIAAMVPASLLFPQLSMQGEQMRGHARMTMPDGTPVVELGSAPDAANAREPRLTSRLQSKQYRFIVTVAMPGSSATANYENPRLAGMVAIVLAALIILFFTLIHRRRTVRDPISDIAKAILADEFVPHYQPIVDIQTGRLLGAEVLVRWRRSDGSFVEPSAFISLIESSGHALELTRSLMRHVCHDLGEALGRRPRLTIAFNVAPRHFDDALILTDIGTIFDGSPIKLSQLVLELTERYEIENLTGMRRTIAALQGLGCKIAIDGVGTGYNGLSYILKLGVDIVKIDKILIESIETEGHSKTIIETLIDLAKNMRMAIIAEGVETFDQVTYLRDRGIGAAQGHVFAPSLPAGSFLKLLDAMDPVVDTVLDPVVRPILDATGGARPKSAAANAVKSKSVSSGSPRN